MSGDLVTADEPTTSLAATAPASTIEVLLSSAIEKGMDPDAMKKLMDMATEHNAREAKKEYARALGAVQAEVGPVYRDAHNDQTRSNYTRLETLHKQLYPVYTRHGFSLSFGEEPCPAEGFKRTVCEVFHTSGHSTHHHLDLPVDDTGIKGNRNKTALHGAASTISYARRYLESMIFNVVFTDEDDDGNQGLSGTVTPDEAADLCALADEVGADHERFLVWVRTFARNVETFEDIPAVHKERVVRALEAKRNRS